jgi:hypothetical protein
MSETLNDTKYNHNKLILTLCVFILLSSHVDGPLQTVSQVYTVLQMSCLMDLHINANETLIPPPPGYFVTLIHGLHSTEW